MNTNETTQINYVPLKVLGCFVGLMFTGFLLIDTFKASTTSPQATEMEANTAKIDAALDELHRIQGK